MLDTTLTGVFSSKWFILLSKFLLANKIPRDSSKRDTPQWVRATPLGSRSKRAVPACFSSSATAWETADWVMNSFFAAFVKAPVSAIASKISKCRKTIFPPSMNKINGLYEIITFSRFHNKRYNSHRERNGYDHETSNRNLRMVSAALTMLLLALYGDTDPGPNLLAVNPAALCWFIIILFLLRKWKINPILILLLSGVFGLVFYLK